MVGLGMPASADPASGAAWVAVSAVCGAYAVVGRLRVLGGRVGGIRMRFELGVKH